MLGGNERGGRQRLLEAGRAADCLLDAHLTSRGRARGTPCLQVLRCLRIQKLKLKIMFDLGRFLAGYSAMIFGDKSALPGFFASYYWAQNIDFSQQGWKSSCNFQALACRRMNFKQSSSLLFQRACNPRPPYPPTFQDADGEVPTDQDKMSTVRDINEECVPDLLARRTREQTQSRKKKRAVSARAPRPPTGAVKAEDKNTAGC
eukprot:scaffold3021_cov236-Pinguiococcus_pyrenoidosus.AAC.5